jgi:hypothetical protein
MSIYAVGYCIHGCGRRVENRDTKTCATCAQEQRRQDRTSAKEKTQVKKVSTKRANQNQVYARLRDEYLNVYRVCEVVECNNRSNQVHHMAGREGDKLTDTNNFLAVCPDCHRKITEDSAWAIEQGYSILRST